MISDYCSTATLLCLKYGSQRTLHFEYVNRDAAVNRSAAEKGYIINILLWWKLMQPNLCDLCQSLTQRWSACSSRQDPYAFHKKYLQESCVQLPKYSLPQIKSSLIVDIAINIFPLFITATQAFMSMIIRFESVALCFKTNYRTFGEIRTPIYPGKFLYRVVV